MTIKKERVGDALFVYDTEQDEENGAVAIASVNRGKTSNGSQYIRCTFEIKPSCPSHEFESVRKILLEYISNG